jgi:hypothetical protein
MQDIQTDKSNQWKQALFGLGGCLVFIALQFQLELWLEDEMSFGYEESSIIAIGLSLLAILTGYLVFRKFLFSPDWKYVGIYSLLMFLMLFAIGPLFADGYMKTTRMALNFAAIMAVMSVFSGQQYPWKKKPSVN